MPQNERAADTEPTIQMSQRTEATSAATVGDREGISHVRAARHPLMSSPGPALLQVARPNRSHVSYAMDEEDCPANDGPDLG